MRSLLSILLFALVCILLLNHCNKDEFGARPFVRLITHEVTDITDSGVTFVGELVEGFTQSVTEIGFIYSSDSLNSITQGNRIVVPLSNTENLFQVRIEKALDKDQKYFVRSYLIASGITNLGNTVTFNSKGSRIPVINSFSPMEAICGDTLKIFGSFFSPYKVENVVKLNSTTLEIIRSSDTSIWVVLQSGDSEGNLIVSVNNTSVTTTSKLNLKQPIISGISSTNAWIGDTLFFTGQNLNLPQSLEIKFGPVLGKIISRTNDQIRWIVTDESVVNTGKITVTAPCKVVYESHYEILTPEIYSVPTVITDPEQNIIIKGKGFLKDHTTGYINGHECRLVSVDPNELNLKIPTVFLNGITKKSTKNYFELKFFGTLININSEFLIDYQSIWTPKNNFPGFSRKNAISFSYSDKIFFGLGGGHQNDYYNDLWIYDPIQDSWNFTSIFPGESRGGAVSFVIGSKAYIGLGKKVINDTSMFFNDLYSYDLINGQWKLLNEFPGNGRAYSACLVLNNQAHVIGGESYLNNKNLEVPDHYLYDLSQDTWIKLSDFPTPFSKSMGTVISDFAYIITEHKLFRFEKNNWTISTNIPYNSDFIHTTALNNKLYFGFGLAYEGNENFFELNVEDDKIKSFTLIVENYISNASLITISNKSYLFCGSESQGLPTQRVWEFDPSKPK